MPKSRMSQRVGFGVNRGSINPKIIVSNNSPVEPKGKDVWINSDNGSIAYYNGSSWVQQFYNLTASRLVATDASAGITNTDLVSWVTATDRQITVTDNVDGSITLSTPQDIDTTANIQFAVGTFSGYCATAGRKKTVAVKADNYTVSVNDEVIIGNTTTLITVTLIPAVGSGQAYKIKNINSGTVIIDGDTADTIDGSATISIDQWNSVELIDYIANAWIKLSEV